jgi:hypothetical protein
MGFSSKSYKEKLRIFFKGLKDKITDKTKHLSEQVYSIVKYSLSICSSS